MVTIKVCMLKWYQYLQNWFQPVSDALTFCSHCDTSFNYTTLYFIFLSVSDIYCQRLHIDDKR